MFVDKVEVLVSAGSGGNGKVSFRHEKFIDRGGPDGGDGGNGGNIVLVGSTRTNTLAAFRYQKEINGNDGSSGEKRKRHGKSGVDLKVNVPVGTAVYRDNVLIADITKEGQEAVISKGGKGGFGNAHFTSSTRRAPQVAEKGEPGEEFVATFELKLIAEVGLIGLPNAGKSTLLSRISNAKPEIANYPFTTIRPNLGVAEIDKNTSLLVADIPGLISGASQGKGLGDDFLRHVERTKVLVHLIDSYSEDIAKDYQTIRNELASYKIDLIQRPEIVVITKIEGLDKDIVEDQLRQLKKVVAKGTKLGSISSQSGDGLKELLKETAKHVKRETSEEVEEAKEEIPVISLDKTDDSWQIGKTRDGYKITGAKIERFAKRTDFENFAGVDRLRDIMRKMGIMHELERKKIEPGEVIYFGDDGEFGHFEY